MAVITLWVEILPNEWPDWRHAPFSAKAGRIRKRRPPKDQRHLFRQINIDVDPYVEFGPYESAKKVQ